MVFVGCPLSAWSLRRVLSWKLFTGARTATLLRVPIRFALAVTFGVIIAVVAAGMILALESGRQNAIALVRDRSERIIETIVQRARFHLDPARDQSEFLAKLCHEGDIDLQDEAALVSQLRAALAGSRRSQRLPSSVRI